MVGGVGSGGGDRSGRGEGRMNGDGEGGGERRDLWAMCGCDISVNRLQIRTGRVKEARHGRQTGT